MLIVVATPKDNEDYWTSVPGKCLKQIQKYNKKIDSYIRSYNSDGLPKFYNSVINTAGAKTSECESDDICVFMHDDVEIHDLFFFEKLKKAHETYDIVGVAGATKQVYTMDKPSLWHMACDNFIWGTGGKPGDGRGFITTPQDRFMNQTFFGPTPFDVDFIDGCFMSFSMDRVRKVGLTFDEDFNFHHYDCSMAIRAKEKGLALGVWPIYLVHQSPGLKSFDKNFLDSDKKFKEKYVNENRIPIN
jgi:GT2 family glycosyltransferase